MIDLYRAKRYCYEDISLIENYHKAIADTEHTWQCHHRNETVMNCGKKELIAKGAYFDRPARELIFLTHLEHLRIHKVGKPSGMKGKTQSESARKAISLKSRGRKMSEESKRKLRPELGGKATLGMKWFSNGKVSTRAFVCPDGFHPGRK